MSEYIKMWVFLLGMVVLALVALFTCDGCSLNIIQQTAKEDADIKDESENNTSSDVDESSIDGGIKDSDINDTSHRETKQAPKDAKRPTLQITP